MNHIRALHWIDILLLFVPLGVVLHYTHQSPLWVFLASGLAIVPLAGWMGRATESLAEKLGAGIGGLLNASFGNAAEMIIAFQGLRAGLTDIVKASITGSILGNLLLVLGLSVLSGGLKHKQQKFNRTAAAMSATMMALSAVALLIPAVFHFVTSDQIRRNAAGQVQIEHELSLEIALVLFVVYVLSLVFSLRTHKDLYIGENASPDVGENASPGKSAQLKPATAVAILVVATVFVAWMSEFLVHAVEPASQMLGLTDVFVGVIVVAVIGNAAEHSTAVMTAMKNQMDLSYHIAVGSSTQIALFVAPVLVFVSYALGKPMDLLFTTFEVITVGLGVGVVTLVALDGESNWMEGVLLLAVYLIFAIAFFFLP